MSFVKFSKRYQERAAAPTPKTDKIWFALSAFATRKYAAVILLVTAALFVFGYMQSQHLKIGDLHEGHQRCMKPLATI